MQQQGFIGPSYTLASVNVDCQRSVNWFPEQDEVGTGKNKEVLSLVPTPGLRLNQTVGSGPIRAQWNSSNNRKFVLSGSGLYEIYTDGTPAVLRGTVGSSRGTAYMSDNGVQLGIAANGSGYVLTFATNVFATITTPGSIAVGQIGFLDGYFVVNQAGTRNFFISGLYAGDQWDALDFGAKEGQPDNIIGVTIDHRELWLHGDKSTEVWFDSGDADFPFARMNGAFIEHGIVGPDAKAKMDNSVYWWCKDANGHGMAYRAVGYSPARVSNHAIEQLVSRYGDLSGATCWTYQEGGHSFWATNFPGAKSTLFFDPATGYWHERTYTRPDGRAVERHRADNHMFADSLHLVGDYKNGNIYEMTSDAGDDNGAPITRQRIAPHVSQDGKLISINEIKIELNNGIGLDGAVQGSDPQVMLRISKDGGHVWGQERIAAIGKIGEYRTRCIWRRMGQARDWVFDLKVTDPVPVTLISNFFDPELGAS